MRTYIILLFTCFHFFVNAQIEWLKDFGAKSESRAVVVDDKGNSYVLVYHNQSNMQFKVGDQIQTVINPKSDSEILLVKLSAEGEPIWIKNFPTTANAHGNHMTIDDKNNIYVTGYFNGAIKFKNESSISSNGAQDVFVVKFTENGDLVWLRNFGGKNMDLARGIAVDKNQNVYVSGIFNGTVNLNNLNQKKANADELLVNSGSFSKAFVLKLNSNGDYQWAVSLNTDGDGSSSIEEIAPDSKGNLYIVGRFSSYPLNVVSGKNTFRIEVEKGNRIIFGKLNKDGIFEYIKSPGYGEGQSVKVDSKDNVIFAGGATRESYFNFDSNEKTAEKPSFWDGFVVKYNDKGKLLWHNHYTGGYSKVNRIALGKNDEIYVTGEFYRTVKFDDTRSESALDVKSSYRNIFVLAYDKNSKIKTFYRTSSTESDESWGLFVDKNDNSFYLSGTSRSAEFKIIARTGGNSQKQLFGSSLYSYKAFVCKLRSEK